MTSESQSRIRRGSKTPTVTQPQSKTVTRDFSSRLENLAHYDEISAIWLAEQKRPSLQPSFPPEAWGALQRNLKPDYGGIAGGIVGESWSAKKAGGCEFRKGTYELRWLGTPPKTSVWGCERTRLGRKQKEDDIRLKPRKTEKVLLLGPIVKPQVTSSTLLLRATTVTFVTSNHRAQ